ncbi:MAG: hypothetical protein KDD84_19370 [Caldilineaceae bacterium]|nr:hypothetical protein [Caldilineaceae bacterium]
MSNSNQLIDAVQNLFALLKQRRIDYVLVGGIAILYYVEGRNTQDLDLIMALSSVDALPEFRVTSKDAYFVRADYNGLQIDVLLTQNPLFKKVRDQYTKVQSFLDQDIPLATVDGLLLLKLYALPSLYRQGNFARVGIYENDVATLLHYYQPNVSALLAELSTHLSESDMAEVRSIVADIQTRISRFRNEKR